MGINMNVYTIYGINCRWDDGFFKDYETIQEQLYDEFGYNNPFPADRQVDVLIDGMGGNYIILGKVLYDSGDFRYCDSMNDYQVLDIYSLNDYKQRYIEQFSKLYVNHMHLVEGKEWKLFNLIHYS